MSDAQQVTGTEQSSGLDVVSEVVQFAVTKKIGSAADAEPGFGVLKQGNALWKKTNPDEKGGTAHIDTEVIFTVDVTVPTATNLAGAQSMVEDEEELVGLINNGAYDKLIGQVRAKFIQRDATGEFTYMAEPTVDLDAALDIIKTPLKRRTLTEAQKTVKFLSGLKDKSAVLDVLKEMGIL